LTIPMVWIYRMRCHGFLAVIILMMLRGYPMTKAELVSQIAVKSDITKKAAEAALKGLIETVHQALKADGQLRIDGLGTFKVIDRMARTGVNPRTGAKLEIPATKALRLRLRRLLRKRSRKLRKRNFR